MRDERRRAINALSACATIRFVIIKCTFLFIAIAVESSNIRSNNCTMLKTSRQIESNLNHIYMQETRQKFSSVAYLNKIHIQVTRVWTINYIYVK